MKKFIALVLVSVLFVGCEDVVYETATDIITEETNITPEAKKIIDKEKQVALNELSDFAELTFNDLNEKVKVCEVNNNYAEIFLYTGLPINKETVENIASKQFPLGYHMLNTFAEAKNKGNKEIIEKYSNMITAYEYINLNFLDNENKGILKYEFVKEKDGKYEIKDIMSSLGNLDIISEVSKASLNK